MSNRNNELSFPTLSELRLLIETHNSMRADCINNDQYEDAQHCLEVVQMAEAIVKSGTVGELAVCPEVLCRLINNVNDAIASNGPNRRLWSRCVDAKYWGRVVVDIARAGGLPLCIGKHDPATVVVVDGFRYKFRNACLVTMF